MFIGERLFFCSTFTLLEDGFEFTRWKWKQSNFVIIFYKLKRCKWNKHKKLLNYATVEDRWAGPFPTYMVLKLYKVTWKQNTNIIHYQFSLGKLQQLIHQSNIDCSLHFLFRLQNQFDEIQVQLDQTLNCIALNIQSSISHA